MFIQVCYSYFKLKIGKYIFSLLVMYFSEIYVKVYLTYLEKKKKYI